ncbi:YqhA family protein [Deinococcus multiflagellatus]|uniref:YqhA family protein n=1 Tax=Deinococcus multiflagellatus TaxID=1656887 RepID=UPI001CCD3F3D|nr:YqhA family protein [Deinococcus multiflagellatus]MBZ9714770.1 YqhA family protein [Deinococcus multiflagellatus]
MKARPPARLGSARRLTLAGAFGFARLIVELGVLSSFAFSLALFVAAIAQAYVTIRAAFAELGQPDTTKRLIVAAVEQADTLLIGMALLIISFGLQALFVGRLQNVPPWLHIDSFDDLKQKLIGIVILALGVNFFSVALKWTGSDILGYGLAISAVILAVGAYSVILTRQGRSPALPPEEPDDAA